MMNWDLVLAGCLLVACLVGCVVIAETFVRGLVQGSRVLARHGSVLCKKLVLLKQRMGRQDASLLKE